MIRHTVYFVGRVQGVGFRATTAAVSKDFPVVGTVRNLADGRVELVAEGEKSALIRFLSKLLLQMDRYVESHSVDESPATGQFGRPWKDRGPGVVIRA